MLVDLAPLRAADQLLPAIGQALGLADIGDRPDAELLVAHLASARLALLLDNAETVVDAAAPCRAEPRARLGPAEFESAWAAGKALTFEEAVALGLAVLR